MVLLVRKAKLVLRVQPALIRLCLARWDHKALRVIPVKLVRLVLTPRFQVHKVQ